MVNMMKTDKEYKELSIKEFNKAAEKYESGNAGIYEMCKRDYPPILEEIRKTEFETLLDAGCGTAPMISLLHEEYSNKKIYWNRPLTQDDRKGKNEKPAQYRIYCGRLRKPAF